MVNTYSVTCKHCDNDVEATIEDAVDWLNPEDVVPVLVCPKCNETIIDYAEYMDDRFED